MLFFLLFTLLTNAQHSINYKNLNFDHVSIEDGLSQITVHSILQDSKGFLWFGTEDGLNRYDGYTFVVFRHDPLDTTSISDNFIWSIFEDSENNLWIGTNSGGLNRYSYATNSFTHYKDQNSRGLNNIRVIFEDSKNELWIGTNDSGVRKFNKENKTFKKINFGSNTDLSIRAITQDQNEVIWIGTNQNGIYTLNILSGRTVHYSINEPITRRLSSNSVWALKTDYENNVWIGTYSGGLNKFVRKENRINDFSSINTKKALVNNNVTSIFIDDFNNPWICTEGGLSIYEVEKNEFHNYVHNLSDLRSLSNSLLRFITSDNSNLIWIGTVGGGINKLNLNKKFNQFSHNPIDENSLSHNMIRAIEEDSEGNIWVGTLGNGINRYDKEKNKFERFDSQIIGLSEKVVTSIFEDENKNIWVGTWGGGLNKIRFVAKGSSYKAVNTEMFNHDPNNVNTISSDIVQDIFEDSNGDLWIGTESGLDRLDVNNNKFEHYKFNPEDENTISDDRIQSNCIIEDRFGYLWIGTWQGLNRIKISNNENENNASEFTRFFRKEGLSENRIISIYEDEINKSSDTLIIWIGTIGGGLNKLTISAGNNGEIKDYKIEYFTEKNGLPSNVIYGILGDDEENLWLSTNNGISKFNPRNKTFRNYDIDDGLQSNQFFWGAFKRTKDGELYFGGINGINSFYPNKLIENTNIPPVFITKCTIETSDGSNSIEIDNIEEISSRKIEIPYDSYNIRFEFAALDYTTPSKNLYEYKFENYDEKEIVKSNVSFVNYTNVGDGEYTFIVKGSNNDGIWNNVGSSLAIKIQTPFWKTWWFILLVLSTITLLISYYITNQVKNILAVERLRTKLAADLHDNIGSSLTEISILSEVITTRLKTEDADVIKSLDKISVKSRKLIDKMSDIVWLVNPQRDSLYDLILRLQDTYSDLLADTDISFRCENLKSLERVSLSMEHRQHLFLIFKEAINNAVTHSKCTDLILNANVSGKTLTMILSDDGTSFDLSSESQGNGLKNMKNRAKKISGKLYLTSDVGKGTVVKYIGHI